MKTCENNEFQKFYHSLRMYNSIIQYVRGKSQCKQLPTVLVIQNSQILLNYVSARTLEIGFAVNSKQMCYIMYGFVQCFVLTFTQSYENVFELILKCACYLSAENQSKPS